MIKQNIDEEKVRHQEYVNELKHHIELLKGEIVTKNEIICKRAEASHRTLKGRNSDKERNYM